MSRFASLFLVAPSWSSLLFSPVFAALLCWSLKSPMGSVSQLLLVKSCWLVLPEVVWYAQNGWQ